ncbi:MAG TPA: hypothetical protein VNI53_06690 [Gammaproteobacteria bacterium]|nr:hypothetical protein [Gammaproteobacteria bacterium]
MGKDAAGFTTSIVADVFSGLFTGEDQDKIDNRAQAHAHIFKQKALPLCVDVQNLKHIQDGLAAGIAAFKAYAVIKKTVAHECQHDINSDNEANFAYAGRSLLILGNTRIPSNFDNATDSIKTRVPTGNHRRLQRPPWIDYLSRLAVA